jgi:signal recognition particle subunit SRP54
MMRRMGPLKGLLGMIPGLGAQLRGTNIDEREIDRLEAIILSMTPAERRHPELIKGSRRLRIAQGSGTTVHAVAQLVKQFEQVRKLMKQLGSGKMPDVGALLRGGR